MAFSWKDVFCDPDLRSQVLDPLARDGAVEAIGALLRTCRAPPEGAEDDFDALGRAAVAFWKKDNVCREAARRGALRLLQWARANGCSWDEGTCSLAARNGHLKVLQWARANGCPWHHWTCAGAAWKGYLEILKWAHENGCPWTTATSACAVHKGQLEVLKWARANGCPWNRDKCLQRAEEHGHTKIAQWIRENDV